jgi:two-component system OmpR family response regulator
MVKLLLVDDDQHIRELIRVYFMREGYQIWEASRGDEALQIAQEQQVDFIILDIMMPGMDGFEFCRQLRHTSNAPILMVTAKNEVIHKMHGFQLGIDDYVVKPFDPLELVMRVKAILKRTQISTTQKVQLGQLLLDQQRLEAVIDGKSIALPLKEFQLLFKLASQPGQIFTREQCILDIWGQDYVGDDRTIDVHIKRLRERFDTYSHYFQITTVRGLGYRVEVTR